MTTHLQLAIGGLGPWEIILILAVVLVLIGAKKQPEQAQGMGQGIKEFIIASRDVQGELDPAMDDHPTYTPPPAPQITEQTSENEEAGDTKKDA